MIKIKAWVTLHNDDNESFTHETELEIPDDCVDSKGELLLDDVAEFVEEWLQSYLDYGAEIVNK